MIVVNVINLSYIYSYHIFNGDLGCYIEKAFAAIC
jgi:hypothetical protein